MSLHVPIFEDKLCRITQTIADTTNSTILVTLFSNSNVLIKLLSTKASDSQASTPLKDAKHISGPTIVCREPEVEAPSAYLVERRRMLKAKSEQREYSRMVAGVSGSSALLRYTQKQGGQSTIKQLGVGFNGLLAAVIVFGVAYKICDNLGLSDSLVRDV
jgi:hypothetical protein